jgi:uncharacterized membrane protein YgcG
MWNPFKNYRERKAAEAKRIADLEAQRQADKLSMLNAAIAAARKPTGPTGFFDRPIPNVGTVQDRRTAMENELSARRAYRADMQRRAMAEDISRSNLNNEADILNVMQAQNILSTFTTGSSDSYTPTPSCTPSSDSGSSSSSSDTSSSSSDCGSSSSDSGSSGGGDW